MYKTIVGDATKPAALGTIPVVIPHVCNTEGKWGAGFVLALSRAFGFLPETGYKGWARGIKLPEDSFHIVEDDPIKRMSLGSTQFVKFPDKKLVIANMIGQVLDYNPTRPPIRYAALGRAMNKVKDVCSHVKDVEIHCPKFGSDLAQGNWDVISLMIEEIWTDNGIPVFVYEFPKP